MNALAVKGLCKRYPAFSLENVSFSVPEGAVMGFIGRNGAGKSTTLKALLGLVHPDAGEVTVLGKSFREEERYIKERIGVVLGGIDFYPKKKVRLLSDVTRRFYSNWQEEKYRHYLDLFGIDQEKRVDQLSTGMRVKYMIALALSHDARLLILDEPTSGLDPVSRSELTELLRRIAADGQRSVLFSTHITSDLEKCASHITFIKDGTIQHTGTLACQPMTLVFCLFGVMLLIPAYPYTVMWFYVMLGLFFSFLNGREQKDVYYSALLPIRKRDTVKANCLFVGLIELLALVIAVPFALLRAKLGIGDNPVGLNANVTLFACGLMLFAVFNAVFLLSFYRTAYKVGVSFVKACIVMAVAAFIMEAAVHFPALSRFNGYDLACQLPLLAAGLVIWCGSWPLIFRGAAARYEKVDL